MKKVILVSLLTLGFVPVRCEVQEGLYSLNKWDSWEKCNATIEVKKELMENMFLFSSEEVNKMLKLWDAYKVASFVILMIVITGVLLSYLTISGLVNGFDSLSSSPPDAEAIGETCKIVLCSLFLEFFIVAFPLKYISENKEEIKEMLDGKDMEKAEMRVAYIQKKKREEVDFDIYKHIFNE